MAKRTAWDHGGKTRHQQGYGTAWDKLRKVILERDCHLCQPCMRDQGRPTPASQVDHIKPKAKGGTDDPDNLQSICAPCHLDKSIRDKGHTPRNRRRYGVSGWPIEE